MKIIFIHKVETDIFVFFIFEISWAPLGMVWLSDTFRITFDNYSVKIDGILVNLKRIEPAPGK